MGSHGEEDTGAPDDCFSGMVKSKPSETGIEGEDERANLGNSLKKLSCTEQRNGAIVTSRNVKSGRDFRFCFLNGRYCRVWGHFNSTSTITLHSCTYIVRQDLLNGKEGTSLSLTVA